MRVIRDLDHLPDGARHGALAIGNFDGVHLGHARIVERLVTRARGLEGPAVVFTFDPHPAAILRPGQLPPPLTTTARKAELLLQLGVDVVVAFPTHEAFLKLTAREFFDHIVRDRIGARALVEGYNFSFGRGRGGDVHALESFCRNAGISLDVVEPVQVEGQVVSSSRIRTLVGEGRLQEAGRMLTRPYRMRGMVIHGAGRGRTLGFPTANLAEIQTLLPAQGIYAGIAPVDGRTWPAAISLGPNPTFGEGGLKIEVYLVGYEGSLYDRPLEVDFLARLRDIQRFASVEELIRQMDQDILAVRQWAQEAVW